LYEDPGQPAVLICGSSGRKTNQRQSLFKFLGQREMATPTDSPPVEKPQLVQRRSISFRTDVVDIICEPTMTRQISNVGCANKCTTCRVGFATIALLEAHEKHCRRASMSLSRTQSLTELSDQSEEFRPSTPDIHVQMGSSPIMQFLCPIKIPL